MRDESITVGKEDVAQADEFDLAKQASSGDQPAFTLLFDRYQARLYRYVLIRVTEQDVAEDLVSETWIQVVRALPRFNPQHEASFAAWLFMIARNQVNQFFRKKHPETVDLEDLAELPAVEGNWLENLDNEALLIRVRAAIESLPPVQAKCVRLRFFAGLRNQEISAVLTVGEKTVAANVARGLSKLRSLLVGE